MVLADDTERHKSEPDPLLEYLRRTGARPEETIYVGDTAHDSQAARAAGISFVFAGWGAASYVDQASYWVHAPSEVLLIAKYAL